MKVYISGAISGKKKLDVQWNFAIVEKLLNKNGFDVINPLKISDWDLEWPTYLAIAKVLICSGEVDALYMLDGWDQSKGSRLEHKWAKEKGLLITYQKKAGA